MELYYEDIPGYEGLYQAGTDGSIRALEKIREIDNGRSKNKRIYEERILKTSTSGNYGKAHKSVTLFKDGKSHCFNVHRLILLTFVENKNNLPCINHINGNKYDNMLENLEWCTFSENSKHAYNIGKNPGSWT